MSGSEFFEWAKTVDEVVLTISDANETDSTVELRVRMAGHTHVARMTTHDDDVSKKLRLIVGKLTRIIDNQIQYRLLNGGK